VAVTPPRFAYGRGRQKQLLRIPTWQTLGVKKGAMRLGNYGDAAWGQAAFLFTRDFTDLRITLNPRGDYNS